MVLIELTRTIIRPITLCVRLTANIVAGHLLITLLNNFLMQRSFTVLFFIGAAPFVLTILERAVAFIQAYVFVTLVTLYARENQ
jgi:F-type H+-transporting ATPase subunit a